MCIALNIVTDVRDFFRCFGSCIDGFRTQKLEKSEDKCVDICFAKIQAFQMQVQKTWQEENARLQEEQAVAAQLAQEALTE